MTTEIEIELDITKKNKNKKNEITFDIRRRIFTKNDT